MVDRKLRVGDGVHRAARRRTIIRPQAFQCAVSPHALGRSDRRWPTRRLLIAGAGGAIYQTPGLAEAADCVERQRYTGARIDGYHRTNEGHVVLNIPQAASSTCTRHEKRGERKDALNDRSS